MIVREARRWLVAAAAVAAAIHVTAGHLVGVAAWGIVASLSWLFRDPPRRGNVHPLTLFSPVNGTVLEAGERNDPYRGQEALGVSLRGSWSGPYLLRSPIEGQIVATWDGWRVPAPGRERVGRALCIRTDEDDEVVLAYAPRVPALHRIRVGQGERVGHGQVIGVLPFGGLAAVYFSGDGRVRARSGERLRAGFDPVADLLHD